MNHASSPRALVLVALFVACFAFLPAAEAACQDGCNSSLFNTFQGDDALISNTTGAGNTALGWRSLFLDSTGSFNTGVGGGALVLNNGDSNTAVGAAALLLNTIGTDNVAVGTDALVFNDDGSDNVAVGAFALAANVSGIENVAVGFNAGASTTGGFSVAVGFNALGSATGRQNTAVGDNALFSVTTGVLNTALGDLAGNDIVAGNNINVIGAFQSGISTTNGEVDNSTYISNIIGAGVDAGTSQFVFVDQDGKLGTTALPGTGNLPSGQPQAMLNRKVEKLEATETNGDFHGPAQRAGRANPKSERPTSAEELCAANSSERSIKRYDATTDLCSRGVRCGKGLSSQKRGACNAQENQKTISKSLIPCHFPG